MTTSELARVDGENRKSNIIFSPASTLSPTRCMVNRETMHSSPAIFPKRCPSQWPNFFNPLACTNASRAYHRGTLAHPSPGSQLRLPRPHLDDPGICHMLMKQCSFRHSSRNLPLKLTTPAFQGSISCIFCHSHRGMGHYDPFAEKFLFPRSAAGSSVAPSVHPIYDASPFCTGMASYQ